MATHLDFGFDHYLLTTGALRSLHDRIDIAYNHDDSKTDLIFRLEKFAADCRENQKTRDNCKKYLDNNFSVEKYTKPKLRQVLAQYNVHYGTNPKRSQLVEIFLDQLPYLKRMNGLGEPDVHTENMTNGFYSMNVNDPAYHLPPNNAAGLHDADPRTVPASTTRKAQRGRHVTFDNASAPTRVQPHRHVKQSASAAGNGHRFAEVPGLQDPRTRTVSDGPHSDSYDGHQQYLANAGHQQHPTHVNQQYPANVNHQQYPANAGHQQHPASVNRQYLANANHQQHPANVNQQYPANANQQYPANFNQQYPANVNHQQYPGNSNNHQYPGQYRAPTVEESEDDDDEADVDALADYLVKIARKGDTVALKKMLSAFQNSRPT